MKAWKVFLIAGVILVIYFFIMSHFYGEKFDLLRQNEPVTITWGYVNLREDYTQYSKIINSLYKGDNVKLTGKKYKYFGEDPKYDVWYQIQTKDGKKGWIFSAAIE